MRQKVTNGDIKKRFILYKGHTGWKIKTRIFGSLLISFSAFAIAESTGIVDVHAATTQTTMSSSAAESPVPAGTSAGNTTGNQTTQATQATAQTQQSNTTQESNTVQESATQDSTNTTEYPVLSQNQNVNVGADTTEVELTPDQIAGHFTASVENRDTGDNDSDPTDNTHPIQIGSDGSVSLTTLGNHPYYSSSGNSTNVPGHQSAHVSFEHEIDFSHNFDMSGALGIGSKSSGGADSVGFIFAPGDPSEATKGGSGGKLGLGGLSNAFGFVFDEWENSDFNDPSKSSITYPYIGWRTTDSSGNLQSTKTGDVQSSSNLNLTRSSQPVNDFTMHYDAGSQMLTVTLNGTSFSRHIDDISTGYSLSVAASTGGSLNDYSAKISKFSYMPKTIPITVHLVDSADQGALLDKTDVNAVANIGDTISIFSTQEAANRAVADGEVDASLVAVIPTDSAGNVYLINGDQVVANNNGTVHVIKGEDGIAGSTYYSYTVTDANDQQMTVPVRLAFKATVTPVDATTKQPISGLDPVTVVAVDGKPVLVQIPGYTPTTVTLTKPATGQTIAEGVIPIDQGTTKTDTSTPTTNTANPVGHYYTVTGQTVDGKSVVDNATVGTGQSISDNLDKQPYQDDKGNSVASGGKTAINSDDYYWSDVGSANATDSLDSTKPQSLDSILLPTTATLNYWEQQANDNQTKADDYKQQAQTMYDSFVGLSGLTTAQKAAADKLLESVVKIYTEVSDENGQAKAAFEKGKTDTAATDIYNDGQTGYTNLVAVQNLLISFNDDLTSLKTTNKDAQNSLTTFDSWSVTYGDDNGFPKVSFGPDFGTPTAAQIQGLNNPDYYQFYTWSSSGMGDTAVTPTDVGQYVLKLTDAGRAYLKSLSTNANAGLYVSGVLTINPKDVVANVNDASVVYGDTPVVSGTFTDDTQKNYETITDKNDFEIFDNTANKIVTADQLQVGGDYSIRYTNQAQKDLKTGNYNITSFNTGKLTVTKRPLTVTAPQGNVGKTYGDSDSSEPELVGTTDGLVNGDTLDSIGVKLVRATGEDAGEYAINMDPSVNVKNYDVTVVPGTFIIGKKPVTVTADNLGKDFGGKDPDLTFDNIESGSLVGTDTKTDLGVTLTRATGEDAGEYDITGTSKSKNYIVTINPGKFTINKADAALTINPVSVTYGAGTPDFTWSVDHTDATDNLTATDFEVVDSTGKVVDSNFQVGEKYTIQLKDGVLKTLNDANSNYVFGTPTSAELTVTPKNITVTAANANKNYGEADPSGYKLTDDSATGLVTGDSLSGLNVTLTRAPGEAAGDYAITGTGDNKNYKIAVTPGIFTINKAGATLDITPITVTYGDDPNFKWSIKDAGATDNLTSDDFEVVDSTGKAVDTQLQAGGDYKVKLKDGVLDKLNNANANYKFADPTGAVLTVTKRDITVTAANANKNYGEVDPSEYKLTDDSATGLVTGDSLSGLNVTLTRAPGEAAGDYAITGSSDSKNYNVKVTPGIFTINKAESTLTITPITVTYGDDPTFKWGIKDAGATDNLTTTDFEVVDSTGKVVDSNFQVGEKYTIQLKDGVLDKLNNANANYKFADPTGAVLTVTKRDITVTAANANKNYGEADPSGYKLTDDSATGLVTGDSLSDLNVTLTRATGEAAGDYAITGTSDSKNYNVTINPGKFTINKADATLAITPITVTYGDTPTYKDSVNVTGATNNLEQSDFEVVDSTGKVVDTNLQVGGDYKVKLKDGALDKLNNANANYKFADPTGATLTVTPRDITVTAADSHKTYGDADPSEFSLTDDSATGLVNGDTLASLGVILSRAGGEDVKTYDINKDASSTLNKNYNIKVTAGTFTINKKDITVKAADNTKVYGSDDPTTFTLSDDSAKQLVNNDKLTDLTVNLTRVAGEDVGVYTISGTATNANYSITVGTGTFTITKADSSFDISHSDVVYGSTPTFTGTSKSDKFTNNLDSTDYEIFDADNNKVENSDLRVDGQYTIQLADGALAKLTSANKNYNFNKFTGNTLTVKPKEIVVTADNSSKIYGAKDPQLTLTSKSADVLVTGDTLEGLGVKLIRDTGENVGSDYAINLDNSSKLNDNYKITVNPGIFKINPLSITVTAADNGKVYGQTDPELTLTPDSAKVLVNGDDLSKLGVKLIRANGEAAGDYDINLDKSSTLDKNYTIKVNPGTFTIKPASAVADSITIEPTKVVYGDTPNFTSTVNISESTDPLDQTDYEVVDAQGNVVNTKLQVGGTYFVQLKDEALDKLHTANPNYTFVKPKAAELDVTPKDITITADNDSKVYGNSDPSTYNLTADSANGLVNGDTLASLGVKLSRVPGEDVDNYAINLANPSGLNKNYNVTFKAGNFSITQKPVTVVAENNSKNYGDVDPTLKLSDDATSVLVKGDSLLDLGVKLSRADGQDIGTYAITGTSDSKNYKVTVTPGIFTINQASAKVKVDSSNITYGDKPSFSAKPSVGSTTFNQDDFEILKDGKIVNASDLQAGSYDVKLTDAAISRLKSENPNYKFNDDAINTATLTVGKRSIVIAVDDQTVYVGQSDPANKAVLRNPRIGDDDLLPSLKLSYQEPDSTTVGAYDITASSDNPNFAITVVPGKLTVLGKDVDKDGNVTITEKDKDGNVVKVTKQWNDDGNKETVYNYDPTTGTKTVTESNDGKQVDQQTIDPTKGKAILPDNDGAATVVTTDDSGEPKIIHYKSDPDKDGLTSADELIKYGTDPLNPDSDGDGINDGDEIKNHTNPLVPNISDDDKPTVVKKNQTVGTTTKMVKLYDKDGKLIADRMLGVNTDWRSDEEYTLNDILYYRVSTNEFVRASDVYLYLYQGPTFIRVYNNEIGNLIDYAGAPSSRSLKPSSEWRTDRIAIINGQKYYRVSTNEFVPVEKVYEYVDSDTDITTNSPTTVYDERGNQTGVILPANAAYKVDKTVVINGFVYYRVATNEFIKSDIKE